MECASAVNVSDEPDTRMRKNPEIYCRGRIMQGNTKNII
jgi:hypothetical protein